MDNPEHVKCVKRTAKSVQHMTYCGREIWDTEFAFEDANHAAENGMAEGRLIACPKCRKTIAAAMAGKWPIK
jgi:hypothetical protein